MRPIRITQTLVHQNDFLLWETWADITARIKRQVQQLIHDALDMHAMTELRSMDGVVCGKLWSRMISCFHNAVRYNFPVILDLHKNELLYSEVTDAGWALFVACETFTHVFGPNATTEGSLLLLRQFMNVAVTNTCDTILEFGHLSSQYEKLWKAAYTIQTAWRRCVACPKYQVCRKRLLREAEDLEEMMTT